MESYEVISVAAVSKEKPPYSSKIIKASALLPDTKMLLAQWDPSRGVQENLERFRTENLFGKASRSRASDILAIFRQRYLERTEDIDALSRLVKGGLPPAALHKILYFYSAENDALLHDFVTDVLVPFHETGRNDVSIEHVQRVIDTWVREGRTTNTWSDYTRRRVSQGVLATLRDFGILEGAVNKRIAPIYLPLSAFAYIAYYLRRDQPSGELLTNHPEWKLFFLDDNAVENLFVEAHQHELLEYHAAGSIIRLDVPASTLPEYADVILERTH